MLTLSQQAMLVCDALNRLPSAADLEHRTVEYGCCPQCCAPCGLLCDLDRDDLLTKVVRQAPEHLWGEDVAWWIDGGVDRVWLRMVWSYVPCPNHDGTSPAPATRTSHDTHFPA